MGPAVSVAVATVAVAYAGERADGTKTTVSSAKYLGTAPRSASSSCLSRPLFLVWVAVHVALALCEWMHSWWRGLCRVSVACAKGRALSHVLLSVNEDVDQDAERRAQQLRSLIMSVSWAFSVGARHVTVYDPHAWVVGAGSLCGVGIRARWTPLHGLLTLVNTRGVLLFTVQATLLVLLLTPVKPI